MFIAAAQIIETVSGKTWADYIHETFLKPLGMIETFTSPLDFKPNTRVAYPHINSKKIPSLNYDNAWGAVGLNTTTTDMTIWLRFLLNGARRLSRWSTTRTTPLHQQYQRQKPLTPTKTSGKLEHPNEDFWTVRTAT